MTTLGKVIIGIGAAAVGVATIAAVKKHHDKKVADEAGWSEMDEENSKQDLKDSIKTHMANKTVDILTFVGKHEKEIKEATMLLSAIAAIVELIGGVKKLRSTMQMSKDISWIKTKLTDEENSKQDLKDFIKTIDDGKPYVIYSVKAV